MDQKMIVILYPAGGFGSTIEYVLRHFGDKFKYVTADIMLDGSMHSFNHDFHPLLIEDFLTVDTSNVEIASPRYADNSGRSIEVVMEKYTTMFSDHKVVFIAVDTDKMVERNWLFSHHKVGHLWKDFSNIFSQEIKKWNPNYSSISDMDTWELREWFSFIIKNSMDSYRHAKSLVPNSWLILNTDDILYNFDESVFKIFNYLEVNLVNQGFSDFIESWLQKQRYILDEFDLIEQIINSTISNNPMHWGKLSLMAEAIIQYRLSKIGYDLKCYNLNVFPDNTNDLLKVLIQVEKS